MNEQPTKTLYWQDTQSIEKICQSLTQNHILITSTDTILGFLATTTLQSFNNINKLKESRPTNRPYIILIPTPTSLASFIDINYLNPNILKLVQACWPGPITFVFKASPVLASHMLSTTNTIALRCPDHTGLQKILARFPNGLFSTSANKSGHNPPTTLLEVDPDLAKNVDFIVSDKQAKTAVIPSTIIDTTIAHDTIKIIRNGNTGLEEIARKLNIKVVP